MQISASSEHVNACVQLQCHATQLLFFDAVSLLYDYIIFMIIASACQGCLNNESISQSAGSSMKIRVTVAGASPAPWQQGMEVVYDGELG